MNLPLNLTLQSTQTQWSALLNPLLSNALIDGRFLTADLINGVTVLNHSLGKTLQGWMIVDQNAAAAIYRSQPLDSKTLTLTSNAAVTVTLWVF